MKIAILHGDIAKDASPDEQDTLVQAAFVADSLAGLGHDVFCVPVSLNLEKTRRELVRSRPSVVFNLVESLAGWGNMVHVVPALLDALGIPYTGAPTEAMFIASSKLLAKERLAGAGLPTAPWLTEPGGPEAAFAAGRWIVKSVWEHASAGLDEDSVFFARRREDVADAIVLRKQRLGGAFFAENFIDGREFNVSLLAGGTPQPEGVARLPHPKWVISGARAGNQRHGHVDTDALPPAEIRFDEYPEGKIRVVGYRAKWEEGSFEYAATTRSFDFPNADGPLLERLLERSLQCWRLFGLRGYARVDFRVDDAGVPWILEVNTNPCLSPDAGFMAAAAQAGLGVADVLQRIIGDAIR